MNDSQTPTLTKDSAAPAGGLLPAPRFSVIIPTYNRAGLVRRAVDSVLGQTFSDHEIIVVDDGSTDGTRESLAPVLGRVRYVFQENRGLAGARNRGIREARGELLAFLDSDDLFEPRFLEAVLETFEAYPAAGAVFSAEREIDEHDNRGDRVYTKRTAGPFFDTAGLLTRDTRVGCGRPPVVRRSCVERLGDFDESFRCAVDIEMWIRYSFDVTMVLQPEPLVLRRIHASNISHDQTTDAAEWLAVLERLERTRPEFVREHRAQFRRMRGKQYLRYGRELLARHGGEPGGLSEARAALRRSLASYPWLGRPYLYLAWSFLAPRSYGRFRRWELGR